MANEKKLPSYFGKPIGEEKEQSSLKFDPANAIGTATKEETSDVDPSTFEKALNLIDIPGSLVRTGLEAAISPDRDVLSSVGNQISKTIESPTTAAASAPTGWDVADTAKYEAFGEEAKNRPPPDSLTGEVLTAAADFIPGFAIEMATDPLGLIMGGANKVKKLIRKPLINASERQAIKAISHYASPAAVLKKGADMKSIGTRLVAEDLQGMLRKPEKLFEKLTGKRHLTKVLPESLNTLQIKTVPEKEG